MNSRLDGFEIQLDPFLSASALYSVSTKHSEVMIEVVESIVFQREMEYADGLFVDRWIHYGPH